VSYCTSFPCNRASAEALTGDHPDLAPFDPQPVLVATEEDEDADRWRLDVYTEDAPPPALIDTLMRLIGLTRKHRPTPAKLEEADWVTLSQSGLEPVRAGRFHVHTAADEPDDAPGVVNLRIEASQAFGTGHHETTAGCLATLDALHRGGRRYRTIVDLGTGTGLLAFAALSLWPRATVMASDIDPVSVEVTAGNAAVNDVPIGMGPGMVMLAQADGTDHPLIRSGAPYDLVIANILAGPLITLAPAIAAIIAPGGTLILAGLLHRQRDAVIRAYRRAGFRHDAASLNGDWPTLRLTMRPRPGWRRPDRVRGTGGLLPGDFGAW
jgi:ribosomal protein L11 methyltransferase